MRKQRPWEAKHLARDQSQDNVAVDSGACVPTFLPEGIDLLPLPSPIMTSLSFFYVNIKYTILTIFE
jgi:hypothetical protein